MHFWARCMVLDNNISCIHKHHLAIFLEWDDIFCCWKPIMVAEYVAFWWGDHYFAFHCVWYVLSFPVICPVISFLMWSCKMRLSALCWTMSRSDTDNTVAINKINMLLYFHRCSWMFYQVHQLIHNDIAFLASACWTECVYVLIQLLSISLKQKVAHLL